MSAGDARRRLVAALRSGPGRWALAAAAVVGVALLLRLDGLTVRTFGHPENLLSGIPMPDWAPPTTRRVDFESFLRGSLYDSHPQLYFVLMLFWTKLFGHGLLAIRLPSALLGAASVLLAYRVARRVTSPPGALLASALLAASGLHLYWSQMARMYVPASFLVLLATLYLLRMQERTTVADSWIYGSAVAAALWTQLFAWPAILMHCVWAAWRALRARAVPSFALPLLLGLVAATPVAAMYRYWTAVGVGQEAPSGGYLAFGFAFSDQVPFWVEPPAAPLPDSVLTVLTVALLAVAIVSRRAPPSAATAAGEFLAGTPSRAYLAALAATALVIAAAIVKMALWAPPHREIARSQLIQCGLYPLAVAAAGSLALVIFGRLQARRPPPARRGGIDLVVLLAVAPLVVMLALSRFESALVARGTVIWLPYLLIAVAAGAVALPGSRWLRGGVAVGLVALSAASAHHYRLAASAPRDYAGLARALAARLEPDDVVWLPKGYRSPPLLYYFSEQEWRQFTTADLRGMIRRRRPERLWIVRWSQDEPQPPGGSSVLDGYRVVDIVRGERRAMAVLVERASQPEPRP